VDEQAGAVRQHRLTVDRQEVHVALPERGLLQWTPDPRRGATCGPE
jgi:hypothetical protein